MYANRASVVTPRTSVPRASTNLKTFARPSRNLKCIVRAAQNTVDPGSLVLVAGATGGVGQLVTAKLIERGYKVRAVTRSGKAGVLSGYGPSLEIVQADLREAAGLERLMAGVQAVACCTGTTAFPSARWQGDNGPRNTDLVATSNLIRATPKDVKRFVFVTSAGVERTGSPPWSILNLFGVLKYKRESEVLLEKSGLPYTILRPSRLTDGPYTSYDLNTLLKATAGNRKAVRLTRSETLTGETSRITCAEAVVQCLSLESTLNTKFSLENMEGEGPGADSGKWQSLFAAAV